MIKALLQKFFVLFKIMLFYNLSSGGFVMKNFKWRHFAGEKILGCVRWIAATG